MAHCGIVPTEAAILRCAQDAKSWPDLAEVARLIAMLARETTANETGQIVS